MSFLDISTEYRYRSRHVRTSLSYNILISNTRLNKYVPVFAFNDNFENTEDNFSYKLELPVNMSYSKNSELRNVITSNLIIHKFIYEKDDFILFARKGLVYTFDNLGKLKLLLVSAIDYSTRNNRSNNRIFKLFINPEVLVNKKYGKLMYYVKKYFVEQVTIQNHEVVFTNDIEKQCFTPLYKTSNFVSFEEMDKSLEKMKEYIANTVKVPLPVPEEPVAIPVEAVIETDNETSERPDTSYEDFADDSDMDEFFNLQVTDTSTAQPIPANGAILPPISADEFADSEEPVVDFVPPNIILSRDSVDAIANVHTFTIPDVETTITLEGSDDEIIINYDSTTIEDAQEVETNQEVSSSGYGYNDDESEILNYGR